MTAALIGGSSASSGERPAADSGRPSRAIEIEPGSEAFAKYAESSSGRLLRRILKLNINYNVQDLPFGAFRTPSCRGVSRADLRFDERASQERGPTGLMLENTSWDR